MKLITGLVIVLGSPNDEKGTISPIGQGRLLKGLEAAVTPTSGIFFQTFQ
jgi:hypothetical protein